MRLGDLARVGALVLWCGGCAPDFDEQLSLANAQVVGTHNSYHVQTTDFAPWNYTHDRLDRQVEGGIRQLELDLWWEDGTWLVYHFPGVDAGTHCGAISACLQDLARGSERAPGHLPILLLLELKTAASGLDDLDTPLEALDEALTTYLREDGLLLPDQVRGEHATLADAMQGGWPALTGQRERVIPVLHVDGRWAERARERGMDGWFYDAYGEVTLPWAAIHSLNDPHDDRIEALVDAGHLVRTRADADLIEPAQGDTRRRDRALASGAHFVSTDFPASAPHPTSGYAVSVGAGPARCNPRRPAEACRDERLER